MDVEAAVRSVGNDVDHAQEGLRPLDDVVVPAVLAISGSAGAPADAFAGPLLEACLRHLRARTADAPPPADATRSTEGLTCACRDCTALAAFVADPQARTWTLKAIAANRAHIESVIRAAGADLDRVTVQKGSPHSLVCTKNQSSYERRARQHRADLDTIARLARARASHKRNRTSRTPIHVREPRDSPVGAIFGSDIGSPSGSPEMLMRPVSA